jgi:hypothetical protein
LPVAPIQIHKLYRRARAGTRRASGRRRPGRQPAPGRTARRRRIVRHPGITPSDTLPPRG